MAKEQHLSRHQQNIVKDYYENLDTAMLQKLGEIVSDLYVSADEPAKVARLWERARKALQQLKVEPSRVSSIVTGRKVEELALFVGDLSKAGKAPPSAPAPPPSTQQKPPSPSPPPGAGPGAGPGAPVAQTTADTEAGDSADRQIRKKAMKAFRKRLKLTRLDEESKLGYGAMTGGHKSGVVAIEPPRQFPPEVWAELVKQGRLKNAGRGFYELVEE